MSKYSKFLPNDKILQMKYCRQCWFNNVPTIGGVCNFNPGEAISHCGYYLIDETSGIPLQRLHPFRAFLCEDDDSIYVIGDMQKYGLNEHVPADREMYVNICVKADMAERNFSADEVDLYNEEILREEQEWLNGLPNYYVELSQSSDKYIVYEDDDVENDDDDTIIITGHDGVSSTAKSCGITSITDSSGTSSISDSSSASSISDSSGASSTAFMSKSLSAMSINSCPTSADTARSAISKVASSISTSTRSVMSGKPRSTTRVDYFKAPKWVYRVLLSVINIDDVSTLYDPCAAGSVFKTVLCDDNYLDDNLHIVEKDLYAEGYDNEDYLCSEFDDYDFLVTNPPYSRKTDFLEKACLSNKPFAMLLPLQALMTCERAAIFKKFSFDIYVLNPSPIFKNIKDEDVQVREIAWFVCMNDKHDTGGNNRLFFLNKPSLDEKLKLAINSLEEKICR